jgi:3-oxoacyl-[acyl-carrier-protein] synthase III
MYTAGIAGSGSFMPKSVISNEELASLIKKEDKGAEWAHERLGIDQRRFMTRLDSEGHPRQRSDELDMAEEASRLAISNAGLNTDDIDAIWYISCTQKGPARHHFSSSVFTLHRKLGLRAESVPLEMDAGCGGALHVMALASSFIENGTFKNVLVVAANGPSRYYNDWEQYRDANVWLSMYIFGDGAGAVVLGRSDDLLSQSTVLSSHLGVDPSEALMWYEPWEGSKEPLYVIDARGVALGFGKYAKLALQGLKNKYHFEYSDISRFYFHQVNGKVLTKFVESESIPLHRVAMHVSRYGNIAAAATLVLLDEDRKLGLVGEGDMCVFCTVGAGAQYGALLVRL